MIPDRIQLLRRRIEEAREALARAKTGGDPAGIAAADVELSRCHVRRELAELAARGDRHAAAFLAGDGPCGAKA